jgi:phosphoesterase RecJ-like protein
MALDWAAFVNLVRAHSRFLLVSHIRPDGDAMGSLLGLGNALTRLGKHVQMTVASPIPPRYDFLDPAKRAQPFCLAEDHSDIEAVIIVDTGAKAQLGDVWKFLESSPVPRLVIDHHQTQDELGGQRLVDTSAEAAGRLVRQAIAALDVPLDAEIAACLFTALATDTGWFHHSNTSAETFALAEELVAAGANPTDIYDRLYEHRGLSRLKLQALAIQRLTLLEIRQEDLREIGANPQDSEDLVNYTRSIVGVEVGLFFLELPNTAGSSSFQGATKVSLRSRSAIDVAALAAKFGGGGHRLAAGVTIASPLEEVRQRLLTLATEAVQALK